ncbi:M20 family metallo-hydrolase [Gynurincola endophyticus]|uniref:M20 family metallo-hydrolase n=1 Tax=Gynurincola endophyticus TaxID=2479004 RepID=UPI000F8C8285|nr:M20 family metallo-hydrolase [Gynurincola endophyticus]
MNNSTQILYKEAVALLQQLIATPSFSKEENHTADIIEQFLQKKSVNVSRLENNVWAKNKYFNESKPTILLNSHHDTVKPNKGYTKDPFQAIEEEKKLFGLGSNDAGGCLVSLIAAFLHYYERKDLQYNLIIAASAEEEISGKNGIELLIPHLPPVSFAIVGEPTLMNMAIAERGLMVLDCTAEGIAGHAARNEGENALYKAMSDINWVHNFHFNRISPFLGPVKMTVTVIETENKAHNVVPAQCKFVIDVRVNELYTFEEILDTIRMNILSRVSPRSTRLRSSIIPLEHPVVQAGIKMGKSYYGSPTTSDKALMPFPALKIGPGDSARSHTADEFIYLEEIENGIKDYINLLNYCITEKP